MHAFARVTVCVCGGGGGVGAIKQGGGGALLSGEGGGHLPQMPPYGDATANAVFVCLSFQWFIQMDTMFNSTCEIINSSISTVSLCAHQQHAVAM